MYEPNDDSDPSGHQGEYELFNSSNVDMYLRQGVSICWMILPKSKRNISNLRVEISRFVERAINDFEEDRPRFEDEKGEGDGAH